MTAVYQEISNRFSRCYPLIVILLIIPLLAVAAEDKKQMKSADKSEENAELTFEVVKSDYEYQIENRTDPFVPFFTGDVATQDLDPNEILDTTKSLSGMQLFEPGQLTLVALMQIKGAYVAMVQDFKGQGYMIEKGTKIGRRGVVKDIAPNKVLIEEVAVTRAGKELKSEIVMALRKEGEE